MTSKYRVLIHSMSFKRDFGMAYILSKLLEQLGCECMLCSNANYISLPFKLWKPHAVFFVTLGRFHKIKKAYPKAKLFLWSADSDKDFTSTDELIVANNKDIFDNISRVYIWGVETKLKLIKAINDSGPNHFLFDKKDLVDSKFILSGHPRFDIMKYSNKSECTGRKTINIGIIGNFWLINAPLTNVTLLEYFNIRAFDLKAINESIKQLNYLLLIRDIVTSLDGSKYNFSLRTYPLESQKLYDNLLSFSKNSISIDSSIDFSSWVNSQDIIIGRASSTSFLQVISAGKVFISLDSLVGADEQDMKNNLSSSEYQQFSDKIFPKNRDAIYKTIENYDSYDNTIPPDFSDYLNRTMFIGNKISSILKVAKDISEILHNDVEKNIGFGLPYNQVLFLNNLNMNYKELRNKNNLHLDYSFFRYKKVLPKAKSEFDPIVDNILKSQS